jgi:Cu(I)/Ag(I) efflux system membrane protein CusA/SilA
MIGGMITAPLLSMLVIPAAWFLMRRRHVPAHRAASEHTLNIP